MAKVKHKSIAKLVDEIAVLTQRLVRVKAANGEGYAQCVTCKNYYHWKQMDGGHCISRKYQATKMMEENIHPQCKRCNGYPDNFTYSNYEDYMKEMYGPEFLEHLKLLARKPASFNRADLEQKKREVSARLAEYEEFAA